MLDEPVVSEGGIRDPFPKENRHLVLVLGDGLLEVVATGEDQGLELLHEQMVEGGVREEDTGVVGVGGDARTQQAVEHDDRARRGEEFVLLWGRDTEPLPQRGEIAEHHSESLVRPFLARPKSIDGVHIEGVAGQVVSPQTLHRHDRPLPEQSLRSPQRLLCLGYGPPVAPQESQTWPAHRAGVGLRVKTPIAGIRVFPAAVRAEPESVHGRVGPVVGKIAEYGEPRPTVDAVDERVTEAPVARVAHLG